MIALDHTFTVDLHVDGAWTLMTDLEKVATCLPGASVYEVIDGEFRGGLSARIGPITANYQGKAVFLEKDDVGHRAVIEARGKEDKGSGTARARITTHLIPEGPLTRVEVSTELTISGRAAQFGRSLLTEVSDSIVADFVTRLQSMTQAGPGSPPQPPALPTPTNLDVGRVVIVPLLHKATAPLLAALAGLTVGVLLARRWRR